MYVELSSKEEVQEWAKKDTIPVKDLLYKVMPVVAVPDIKLIIQKVCKLALITDIYLIVIVFWNLDGTRDICSWADSLICHSCTLEDNVSTDC